MSPTPPADLATSRRLARQKQSATKPELTVRAALRGREIAYRLSNSDLPGSPDLANRSKRFAIFVHGCFWHHHAGCPRATLPKRNREFWREKFAANRSRDARAVAALEAMGMRCLTLFECEIADPAGLERTLDAFFEETDRSWRCTSSGANSNAANACWLGR